MGQVSDPLQPVLAFTPPTHWDSLISKARHCTMFGDSPEQITVHPLPSLPHPSALITYATPSAFLLDAKRTYDELGALKQSILADSKGKDAKPAESDTYE